MGSDNNFGQANMTIRINFVSIILECAICLQRTHPKMFLDIDILLTKSQVHH
jgi:hypothetical protein